MTRWRTGTKNPHTLYLDDKPAGFFLEPALAQLVVERLNCFPCIALAAPGIGDRCSKCDQRLDSEETCDAYHQALLDNELPVPDQPSLLREARWLLSDAGDDSPDWPARSKAWHEAMAKVKP